MKKNPGIIVVILTGMLLAAIAAGLYWGAVRIPMHEYLLPENRLILGMRLLRVCAAIVAGCGLTVSGIVLQAVLRNPLAEPYLLGTSSGAGLGVVIVIVLGGAGIVLPAAAFAGALLTTALVYRIALHNGRASEHTLILSGVIVSVAASAVMVFLISVSRKESLHGIIWWLWGNLQVVDARLLAGVTAIVVAAGVTVYFLSQDMNAISMGEEEALHVGINVHTVRNILIVLATLISASLVCVCGIIGFVGLVVPHMVRFVVGPNHKTLIPVACLSAAVFMVICDLCSRVIAPPFEIPIGVITAVIGAGAFIVLLKKKQKYG